MDYETCEVVFDSSNRLNQVHGRILIPEDREHLKGSVQFSHGMCEYFDKYQEFYEFMLSNGYVVCGHDHIGHGDSVISEEERGFFASKDGYKYLVEDVYQMTKIVKKKFPYLQCFLLGHSMGSFIARCYAAKYGDRIDGLLLCGTMGPQWAADGGIQMADRIIRKKGPLYRSKKLDRLSFEFANANFEPIKTRYDWTCSNEEAILRHMKDKKSDFIFTASGFKDLFYLVKLCNDEKFIKNTPKNLPILLFSGDMDPVGENGIGVKRVAELYKKIGVKEVEVKLYQDKRHEMLNEVNREEVYRDILNWLEVIRFGEE
ncbi:MAG: alpha/beta fold hydrolase [Clostridia bacterium]|nr:alpha/beta fold hydrolase [Clostridia bacterium]